MARRWGTIVAAFLVVTGVVLTLVSGTGSGTYPVVRESVTRVRPVVELVELREIYDDSMRQLNSCIDDRRRDPTTASGSFPC